MCRACRAAKEGLDPAEVGKSIVESRGGASPVGGRWVIRCFRSRAAGRLPWARFLPPLSEPGVPISGTGLSSGIMRLARGFPVATRGRVLASPGTGLADDQAVAALEDAPGLGEGVEDGHDLTQRPGSEKPLAGSNPVLFF